MNFIWSLSALLVFCAFVFPTYTEARYLNSKDEERNIPQLLSRLFAKVGKDRFITSWKEFNSRSHVQQDDFLTDGLADNELTQLEDDFNSFAEALTQQPRLVDWYADFEANLSPNAFAKMDESIGSSEPWWGRLKIFLYRKIEKLADEITQEGKL